MCAKFHVEKELVCKQCKETFYGLTLKQEYCSDKCKGIYLKNEESKKLKESGIENVDYVICKWCGMAVKRMIGGHMKRFHPEKTSLDYKAEFGNEVLMRTPSDKKATTSHFGYHMKEDKWREWAKNRMTGEKNIMSKTNASEEKRKQTSPYSIEFYKKRNPELTDDECKLLMKETLKEYNKDRLFWNQKEYWIKKGLTETDAKNKVSELQNRGLSYLMTKYGEEEGYSRWKKRTDLWKSKVFNKNTYIGGGTSMIAELLFENIFNGIKDISTIKHGKNEKFIYDKESKTAYKYDFTDIKTKKIIEFNGDFWHCNPNIKKDFSDSDYFHKVKKMKAKDIWKYDERKIEIAKSYGYKVKVIWETNYRKDPDRVVQECLDFLKE